MLEIEDLAANPRQSQAPEMFGRLKPGQKVLVHPSIPRPAEHREYRVQAVESGRIVLSERPADPPLTVAAASVARLHSAREQKPAELILKGRLQWITPTRQWTILPEEPDSEHGLHKLTSAGDPRVVDFIERLRRQGYSAWWVPLASVAEFLGQGGEIVYDLDGRYLRIRDHRSDWVLLGKNASDTVLL